MVYRGNIRTSYDAANAVAACDAAARAQAGSMLAEVAGREGWREWKRRSRCARVVLLTARERAASEERLRS